MLERSEMYLDRKGLEELNNEKMKVMFSEV